MKSCVTAGSDSIVEILAVYKLAGKDLEYIYISAKAAQHGLAIIGSEKSSQPILQ